MNHIKTFKLFENVNKVWTNKNLTDDRYPRYREYVILDVDGKKDLYSGIEEGDFNDSVYREYIQFLRCNIGEVKNKTPYTNSVSINFQNVPESIRRRYLEDDWENFQKHEIKYWSKSREELQKIIDADSECVACKFGL